MEDLSLPADPTEDLAHSWVAATSAALLEGLVCVCEPVCVQ